MRKGFIGVLSASYYKGGPMKTFNTIRTMLNRNIHLYPDNTAMVEIGGRERVYTYRMLYDRASRMANALNALGVKKGDRVAILSQNSFEYMALSVALPNAGFIFVVCNFRLAEPEMAAVLADSEPTVLIVQDTFRDLALRVKENVKSIKECICFGSPIERPAGWHDYEELIKKASAEPQTVEIYEDDIAMLMYTSGTTGLPKGVMQTHGNLYHAGRACSMNNEITIDDKVFVVCPMYHITAHYNFFGAFYMSTPAYIFPHWDVPLLLSMTEKHKLSAGMLATPMVMMIMEHPDHKKYDVSSWRSLWFAGAGIIPAVYRKFIDTYGNILGEHHGTTETTGVTTNLSHRDIRAAFERGDYNILESCGITSRDMEVLIVDEEGRPVGPGGTGEMIVRGPGVSLGYWRKEEGTKKVFRGEWFHTEDICSVDARADTYG